MRGAASTRAPVRAVALATLSALLTAVGHLAGGGDLPDLAMLVVLLPLLTGLFVSIAERSRSLLGTIATLGSGQLALHELLTLLHPTHAGGPVPSALPMLSMHALVTLAVAVALRHADAAVAAVAAAVRRLVPRRLVPPPATRPLPTFVAAPAELSARIAGLVAMAQVRRGPPVGC